ncbi:MAG: heat-inducible transcriptional repressor HrcA [Alphaproteobacteria bacterium]|nr:heat-inducible transcriptional repressor HrcA [Alphaproteobacteria bacterium]
MNKQVSTLSELNNRFRDIFKSVVDAYLETGEPVGSKTISQLLNFSLSPATIRNVMADLEEAGLLFSPHTSAGRIPTERGLKLFVDGFLEIGSLEKEERHAIEAHCRTTGINMETMLTQATTMLSGLSKCAGLVVAPKTQAPLKHIEFVHLGSGRALVVMVTADGVVENRLITIPAGTLPAALTEATNYLNTRLQGRTLEEARSEILTEMDSHKAQLDAVSSRLVAEGLAAWGGDKKGFLIVKGQANLLDNIQAAEDLERVRTLFNVLEAQESMTKLLDLTEKAEGVQIYIGSENELFALSGCSMIMAPYRNSNEKIIGAVGIIGPTRMNYARIIPLVNYTSQVVSKLIG